MLGNEIKLNITDTRMKLNALKSNANTMKIETLKSDITSQSDAMDKFVSAYEDYKITLENYLALLNNDLKNISASVSVIEKLDSDAGKSIFSLNAPPTIQIKG